MDPAVVNDLNPHHWGAESFKIAEDFVYTNIHENEELTPAYIAEGRKLAEK